VKRGWWAATLGAVLMLAGCGDDRFPDYRYKMTIYVSTSEGEKAFSSVREVVNEEISSIQSSSGRSVKTSLKGEAVVLDIPGRTTPVFALLSRPYDPDYAKKIAGAALKPTRDADDDGGMDSHAAWMQRMVAVKGPRELPRTRPPMPPEKGPQQQWPMFVTFDDANDPKTIREVNPDDLGVNRITIEITDDGASDLIGEWLQWLGQYPEPSLDPAHGPFDRSLPATIHHGDFRTVESK
jgi:hypothetical protein